MKSLSVMLRVVITNPLFSAIAEQVWHICCIDYMMIIYAANIEPGSVISGSYCMTHNEWG